MKNILIYAQDPGGAQNIAIAANRLVGKGEANTTIIVHPLAKAIFEKFHLPFQLITDLGFSVPLDEKQAEDFLIGGGFTHIFCGTSNPRYDRSNSNIIKAAHKLSLPCFAFLEHWKGWGRFYDENGELAYVPDILGCIDNFSAIKLEQVGIPKHRLAVVGHPHLEWIYKQMQAGVFRSRDKLKKEIILVSQPQVSKNFESILSLPIGSTSLVECIGDILRELRERLDFAVFYRPHPKEQALAVLPEGIIPDKQQSWIDVLKDVDIIVGLDSMALIEAFFAGKMCISLKLPELKDITDMDCSIEFSRRVSNLEEFNSALTHALIEDREYFPSVEGNKPLVEGSNKRIIAAFSEFLKQTVRGQ